MAAGIAGLARARAGLILRGNVFSAQIGYVIVGKARRATAGNMPDTVRENAPRQPVERIVNRRRRRSAWGCCSDLRLPWCGLRGYSPPPYSCQS